MPPLRIYIADDHPFVRLGLRRLLQTFYRVGDIKEAENGKDLIDLVERASPDIVVLDIEMPIMNGFETAKYLVKHYPLIKILVLTMHSEDLFVLRLIDIGVHGFLTKNSSLEELERALYSIADRDFYKNDIVHTAVRNSVTRKKSRQLSDELSSREIEVLMLICKELSPTEISSRLKISEKTFFNHRSHILLKVGVRSNVGLLRYAYQEKLIELPF